MNAFAILGVPTNADDASVRKAYVDLIKMFGPDSDGKKFQIIHNAYELIKTERLRKKYLISLSECQESSVFDLLRAYASWPMARKPLDFQTLKEFLQTCSNR